MNLPEFKLMGDANLLLEWNHEINKSLLNQILSFQSAIRQLKIEGIIETWPAYKSLAVAFDPDLIDTKSLINVLSKITINPISVDDSKIWQIPVCYEYEYGQDLEEMEKALNLNSDEIIKIHTSTDYLVHFQGFLPGFMYLSGLNSSLHLPRKQTPPLRIPEGSVAIGGNQTGIYPTSSPGGWYILGNCPLKLFDAKSPNPCFVHPGDTVRFSAVSKQEYKVAKLESHLDVFDFNSILKDE
ncbi:MAG: 5-oxoprolinase subunit PxpB [Cyclobacteriaceae bacterium]